MEWSANIRNKLNQIVTQNDLSQIQNELSLKTADEVFRVLFPIAISGREGNAPYFAGALLIEMQPDCPETIEGILTQVHQSKYFLSFKEVPFYLITQFGKKTVIEAAKKFLESIAPEQSRVETISYWANSPAFTLCNTYNNWVTEQLYDDINKI